MWTTPRTGTRCRPRARPLPPSSNVEVSPELPANTSELGAAKKMHGHVEIIGYS